MANTAAPFGFRQYRGTGSSPTYEQVPGFIAYGAVAIYYGDPVLRTTDGSIITAGSATSTPIAGIFVGCKFLSVSQKRTVWLNYWPNSDMASGNTAECYLINDPNAQFVVQTGNSTTSGLTAGSIGYNVNHNIGTGNAGNGISGAYIDVGISPTTTSALPFRLVGLVTDPPGAPGTATGAYNNVIVAFNNVETKSLTATA